MPTTIVQIKQQDFAFVSYVCSKMYVFQNSWTNGHDSFTRLQFVLHIPNIGCHLLLVKINDDANLRPMDVGLYIHTHIHTEEPKIRKKEKKRKDR